MSHEPLIEAVANTAHHMVGREHYASHDIQTKLDSLQSQLQELKDLASARRLKLLDAVESQQVTVQCFVLVFEVGKKRGAETQKRRNVTEMLSYNQLSNCVVIDSFRLGCLVTI